MGAEDRRPVPLSTRRRRLQRDQGTDLAPSQGPLTVTVVVAISSVRLIGCADNGVRSGAVSRGSS